MINYSHIKILDADFSRQGHFYQFDGKYTVNAHPVRAICDYVETGYPFGYTLDIYKGLYDFSEKLNGTLPPKVAQLSYNRFGNDRLGKYFKEKRKEYEKEIVNPIMRTCYVEVEMIKQELGL